MNLWQDMKKPVFCLAPMEDVTDTVFRQILCTAGKPDVFFTEFTNVDGIASGGHDIVARRLQFAKIEHPLVAQIWGMQPENYYKAAKELVEKGFDAIDINMGCPQHDVIRHGACSALIKNRQLATEIIKATQEGANSTNSGRAQNVPVSVKTRIGFKTIQTEDWIGFLLGHNLDVLTVHGRTAAEMSKVLCHWDEIGKAVMLRDELEMKQSVIASKAKQSNIDKYEIATSPSAPRNDNHHTLIFGNGDVESLDDAKDKVGKYHVDGVMIGRGIFHNPWLFAGVDPQTKSIKDRLLLLEKHVRLYEKTWGEAKSFQVLKKYFKIYLSDFDGASDMRQKFMETNAYKEALDLVSTLLASE